MKMIIDESMATQAMPTKSIEKTISVSANNGDLEFVEDNNDPVSAVYILSANFDNITTTYPDNFITEHTVNYELIEGTDSEIEDVVNDKFKYTSNYAAGALEKGEGGVGADILIRYIIRTKKMRATFRTFSTDTFGDKRDKTLPIVIAGIPRLFFLCMTNNMKYNPGGGMSTLTTTNSDLFQREITFVPSIDPDLASKGLKHHFSDPKGSWPGVDIDGIQTDDAMEYNFSMAGISLPDLEV